jgi:putative transposase
MPRPTRIDIGDQLYHVINRANARLQIFFEKDDYSELERILKKGVEKFQMRIVAYCLMPNHFHLVLYPRQDKDVQKFMQWITLIHTQEWHVEHGTVGTGHLYQGRYKSFLIKKDVHLQSVIRYVERNPVKAGLARLPEEWNFSSAAKRIKNKTNKEWVSEWPIEMPVDYKSFLYDPSAVDKKIIYPVKKRGRPFAENRG